MSLTRETDYGKITISNEIFKDSIIRACNEPECESGIWLAAKPAIEAEYGEGGRISLEFAVVVKFGVHIREICKTVADKVAEQIKAKSGNMPSTITVKVVGVKSRNVVKRSMEVIFEY